MIGFQQVISTEISLPLLGMRRDGSAFFQYLLRGVTLHSLEGSIPEWLVQQDRLEKGDSIRPNLPLNIDGHFLDEGEVISAEWNPEESAQFFTLSLTPVDATGIPVLLYLESGRIILRGDNGAEEILGALLKDSYLLKRGITIYLKHLYPFFSRRAEYPSEDYQSLKTEVFDDVRNRVLKNAGEIERCYHSIIEGEGDPYLGLDLDILRVWSEPEIQPELFRMTFGSDTVERYLSAILTLNQKVLMNYNTITLLYSSHLA